jgi:hypothetical protein
LLPQTAKSAFDFALLRAGNNNADKIVIIAITTNSSMSVKPSIFGPVDAPSPLRFEPQRASSPLLAILTAMGIPEA